MKKLSIIVKYLSFVSMISGVPIVVLGVFFEFKKITFSPFVIAEFCILMLVIVSTVLGGCFEGLMGQDKPLELLNFTPFNIVFYGIFFIIGISMIVRGNLSTAFLAAGVINSYKLFDLSRKYIQFGSDKCKITDMLK